MGIAKYTPRSLDKDIVCVAGTIDRDGNTINGKGFTATYGAPGIYTVTFTNKFPTLMGVFCGVERSSVDDFSTWFTSYTASTGVLILNTLNAGAAAQLPNTPDGYLHFIAFFKKISGTIYYDMKCAQKGLTIHTAYCDKDATVDSGTILDSTLGIANAGGVYTVNYSYPVIANKNVGGMVQIQDAAADDVIAQLTSTSATTTVATVWDLGDTAAKQLTTDGFLYFAIIHVD
jgi:hypothetical protein